MFLKRIKKILIGVAILVAIFFTSIVNATISQADPFNEYIQFSTPAPNDNPVEGISSAAISGDGRYRAYVYDQGVVQYSSDYGANFVQLTSNPGIYTQVAISNNGAHILIGYAGTLSNADDNSLLISDDHGITWRTLISPSSDLWARLTISDDGLVISAITSEYISSGLTKKFTFRNSVDGGLTWTTGETRTEWSLKPTLVSSATGSKIAFTTAYGNLKISSNSGASWVDTGIRAQSVAMSSDGMFILAGDSHPTTQYGQSELLYKSSDGGATFTHQDFFSLYYRPGNSNKIHFLAISDDGKTQFVYTDNHGPGVSHLFYSTNSGNTFSESQYFPENANLAAVESVGVLLSSLGNVAIINHGEVLYKSNLPVPNAITAVRVSAGNTAATLSWDYPTSGPAFTDYVLQYSSNNGSNWTSIPHTPSNTETSRTVSGLTNGVSYLFRISAKNDVGYGNFATSQAITPGKKSWAPLNLTLTPGNQSLSLEWSEPQWNGDSPIRGYRIEYSTSPTGAYIVDITTAADVHHATISGLINGTNYFVKVIPINDLGDGTPARNFGNVGVAPRTLPSEPRNLVVTYDGIQINLSWNAPLSNGGAAISNYKIFKLKTCPDAANTSSEVLTNSSQTSYTLSDLDIGCIQRLTIKAINSSGEGGLSNDAFIDLSMPGTVATPSVTPGDQSALITWSAPVVSDAPLTNYQIQYTINNGLTWTTFDHGASTSRFITVTGLTNGSIYRFRVAGVNVAGTGNYSSASSPITPSGIPGVPSSVAATASDQTAIVTWTAPSANGAAISDYKIELSSDAGLTWSTYSHAESSSTNATVTGLTNYLAYIFRISAYNANGYGEASSTSTAVNPGSTIASISISTPASGVKNGSAFTTQPVVTLKDGSGLTITTDSASVVIASVSSGGTLIGTKKATANNGVVTFSNLGLNGIPGTSYTLSFTAGGFTDTQTVTAVIGDPYKLALTRVGVGGQAGVSFSIQPVIKIQDVVGNNISTDSTTLITASTSTANCYTENATKTVSSGIATFVDFGITGTAGTTCLISFSATGLVADSQTAVITPGPKRYLTKVKNTPGSWSGVYGRNLTEQPVYKITDSGGNIITGDNSTIVTVTGPVGSTVSQQTATASGGIVTFDHLGFTGVSLGYVSFSVSYVGLITPTTDSADITKGDPVFSWNGVTKKTTDLNFSLSAPTSNTAGSFVYSSGNNSVLSISGSTATINGPGTCVVTATFTPTDTVRFNSGTSETMTVTVTQGFTISTSADSHSSITATAAVDTGTSTTITFSGNTGYRISGITLDGTVLSTSSTPKLADVIAASTYTFTNVSADHSISITSEIKSYTITSLTSSGGSISDSGQSTVSHGSSSSLYTFTASVDYQLSTVLIDGVALTGSSLSNAIANGYTFTNVDSDHEISVSYSLIPITSFTVTTSKDSHSSITPSATVASGSSKKVTFATASGYKVTGIILNGTVLTGSTTPTLVSLISAGSYTFGNVTANSSIAISTGLQSYEITATSGAHGSISSVGITSVSHGSNSSIYTFTPASGYRVLSITVDGRGLSSSTTPTLATAKSSGYQFSNVSADHTIAVSFEEVPTPTPTPTSTPGQGFVVSNSLTNFSKVSMTSNSLSLTLKIGRTLRISIPTVGSKTTKVVTMVKLSDGKNVKLGSVTVPKNQGYLTPGIKFTKAGTYSMSITIGSVSKRVVIRVPRS